MRRPLLVLLLVMTFVPALPVLTAEDERAEPRPEGTWRGELATGEAASQKLLRVTLRIRMDKSAALAASVEGIANTHGILRVENLVLVEDVLSFQVPQVDGRFAGNFYGDSLRGTWSEGEKSRPLIFYRD